MKKLLGISFLSAALLAGCDKPQPQKPAPVVAPPPSQAPPPAPTSGIPATAVAEPGAPVPAPNVSPMEFSNATYLTLLVQDFYAKNGRVPKDINELVTAKMIQTPPKPPPGTRYVIDAKNRQVVIVRQ